jgi:hypothetical protein
VTGTTILWIALPSGTVDAPAGRTARLSALVAPRLTADGAQPAAGALTLASFPAVASWADRVQPGAVSFEVQVDGGPTLPATIASEAPDAALWRALFPPTTTVDPHAFDRDDLIGRPISSYSQSKLLRQIHGGYGDVFGSSPVALPGGGRILPAFPAIAAALATPERAPVALAELLPPAAAPRAEQEAALTEAHAALADDVVRRAAAGDLAGAVADAAAVAARLAELRPRGSFTPLLPATDNPASELARLLAFHHATAPVADAAPAGGPDSPDLDFHATLTTLRDHPLLLRRLGLVFDLQVPLASIPESLLDAQSPLRLRVVPAFAPALAVDAVVSPWTAYAREDAQVFAAAPTFSSSPEIVAGMLNVALPDEFDLLQVDADGAALKTVNLVANQMRLGSGDAASDGTGAPADGTAGSPDEVGVPSLRGTGIALIRNEHDHALNARLAAAEHNEEALKADPGEVTLYAEDLTRGYRIDVRDLTAQAGWASLHRRVGTYAFPTHEGGPLSLPVADEGAAQPTAAHDPDTGAAATRPALRVHEALARWEGWSLAAPRPGKAIGDDGATDVTSTPPPGGLQLQASFDAQDASLPRLRYGRSYQLRARAVDLAGNSPSLEDADATLAAVGRTTPVLPADPGGAVYRRFEPVTAPVLVAREEDTEGESIERLVIRSTAGETTTACAARLTAAVASRSGEPVRYAAVNERHLVPPKTAQIVAERYGLLDASFGPQPGSPPASTYAVASREKGQLGPLHPEPQLVLPYLPDPHAAGSALCGLPGLAHGQQAVRDASAGFEIGPSSLDAETLAVVHSVAWVPWDGDWPDLQPFRLRLAEPPGGSAAAPPTWDAAERVVTVFLAKGEQATVRLSSMLGSHVDWMGLWQWLVDDRDANGLGAPPQSAIDAALGGLAWMLTPFRTITLVHAVQRPLLAPPLDGLTVAREPGSTAATFGGPVPVHGATTAKVDLMASWQEPVDAPDEPGPRTVAADAHVLELPIPPPPALGSYAPSADDPSMGVLTLGPKPHGHPPPHGPGNPPPQGPGKPPPKKNGNGSNGDGPPPGEPVLARHEFGDTRYRRVSYRAVATSRHREYFPPEVTGDPDMITVVAGAAIRDVPSSARPAAPMVRYAVPTTRWERPADPTRPRLRHGGGVRVYLDRPWYSSGDGELLGVVLADASAYPPFNTLPPSLRPYVTHWGDDPTWASSPLVGPPNPVSPPATVGRSGLSLAEAGGAGAPPDARVSVVGHEVAFDANRGLWYSDIQIASGATYMPFVRFALARFQPSSVPDCELSRVVTLPFVQLLPDRTVTVTGPTAADPDRVGIRVDGVSYLSSACPPPPDPSADPDVIHVEGIDPIPPLVTVTVEQRFPGAIDEAGWRPAPADLPIGVQADLVISGAGQGSAGGPLWSGQVTLPPARTSGQFRIVVREYEHQLSDVLQAYSVTSVITDGPPGRPPPPPQVEEFTYNPGSGRLVFVETIDV